MPTPPDCRSRPVTLVVALATGATLAVAAMLGVLAGHRDPVQAGAASIGGMPLGAVLLLLLARIEETPHEPRS